MKPAWWVNRVMDDRRIAAEVRWLIVWFSKRPASWRYSVDEAQSFAGVGRQKYQGMMKAAKASGYIQTDHKRDRFGRIIYTKLIIHNTPPEGGKSCLRAEPIRKAGSKASGPKGGKSCQTSLIDDVEKSLTAEVKSERFRVIAGGRNA